MAETSQHEIFWQDRRVSHDRRQGPTRSLHHHGITGRRVKNRRKSDILASTDHFDKSLLFAAIAIIVLSVVDFILTSYIISKGGSELNLLMETVVKQGETIFFITKYSLTALAVFLLVAHNNHYFMRTIRVKSILYTFAFGYLALFLYELHLIASI